MNVRLQRRDDAGPTLLEQLSARSSARFDADGITVHFDEAKSAPVSAISRRWDRAELSKPEKTPEGFLRADAHITRAGVFEYRRFDGSVVREWRPPQEVFDAKSLASFALVPLTLGHPPDNLTPSTVRDHYVGSVGEPKRDGNHARAQMLVTDPRAIAAIEGGRNKVSCGYTANVIERRGRVVMDGVEHEFDAVQTEIRGNHIAIAVDRPRAGDTAQIRIDASDAEQRTDTYASVDELPDYVREILPVDARAIWMKAFNAAFARDYDDGAGWKAAWAAVKNAGFEKNAKTGAWSKKVTKDDAGPADRRDAKESKMEEEITIGGQTYKVPKAVADAYNARKDAADVDALTKKVSRLDAQVDVLTEENAGLKKKLDAAEKARADEVAKIAERAEKRAKLILDAMMLAPKLFEKTDKTPALDTSKLTDAQIMRETLLAHADEKDRAELKTKLDAKGELYVESRFDALMEERAKRGDSRTTAIGAALAANGAGLRPAGDDTTRSPGAQTERSDSDKARDEYIERLKTKKTTAQA